jgi:hypothetical protein
MATVNLGRIKSVWRGTWATGTAYSRDDVVQEGGNSYICTQAHTAGATFAGDSANWDLMAQGAEIPSQSGQAGKALVTDGSTLSWGNGGSVVKLGSADITSNVTSFSINGLFDDTKYRSYRMHIKHLQAKDGSNNNQLQFVVLVNGSGNRDNSYTWTIQEAYNSGHTFRSGASNDKFGQMNGTWSCEANNFTARQNYIIEFSSPQSTDKGKQFKWWGYLYQDNGSHGVTTEGSGTWTNPGAISGLEFWCTNGCNFVVEYDLYGII